MTICIPRHQSPDIIWEAQLHTFNQHNQHHMQHFTDALLLASSNYLKHCAIQENQTVDDDVQELDPITGQPVKAPDWTQVRRRFRTLVFNGFEELHSLVTREFFIWFIVPELPNQNITCNYPHFSQVLIQQLTRPQVLRLTTKLMQLLTRYKEIYHLQVSHFIIESNQFVHGLLKLFTRGPRQLMSKLVLTDEVHHRLRTSQSWQFLIQESILRFKTTFDKFEEEFWILMKELDGQVPSVKIMLNVPRENPGPVLLYLRGPIRENSLHVPRKRKKVVRGILVPTGQIPRIDDQNDPVPNLSDRKIIDSSASELTVQNQGITKQNFTIPNVSTQRDSNPKESVSNVPIPEVPESVVSIVPDSMASMDPSLPDRGISKQGSSVQIDLNPKASVPSLPDLSVQIQKASIVPFPKLPEPEVQKQKPFAPNLPNQKDPYQETQVPSIPDPNLPEPKVPDQETPVPKVLDPKLPIPRIVIRKDQSTLAWKAVPKLPNTSTLSSSSVAPPRTTSSTKTPLKKPRTNQPRVTLSYKLSILICETIRSSPDYRVTHRDVIQYITEHYPEIVHELGCSNWYKSVGPTLSKVFDKVPRSVAVPIGSSNLTHFWTLLNNDRILQDPSRMPKRWISERTAKVKQQRRSKPKPLKDPHTPEYSYRELISFALESSSNKRMKIKEIYAYICGKFPYYEFTRKEWHANLRSKLAIYFQRMEKVGRAHYWTFRSSSTSSVVGQNGRGRMKLPEQTEPLDLSSGSHAKT